MFDKFEELMLSDGTQLVKRLSDGALFKKVFMPIENTSNFMLVIEPYQA